ncbi:glycosyltransferase [Saccharicrinis sp. FJH54]|uniref:glycosyltransferase n=1 Tax=Saccharicrinis sp. FJH54 TaxID=3344665 RepID=UPI0035D44BFF
MMLISVVIPAYNEADYLEETILNIQDRFTKLLPEKGLWEIIVCNNNSTDHTGEVAKRLGIQVVFEPVNQISRARNTGAHSAKGEWILFLDADTHPGMELMKDVLDIIRSGRYIGCGATLQITGGTKFNKLRLERVNPVIRWFKLAAGSFLLCRRDMFEETGGFSKDLYALEEIDFVFRLKRIGRRVNKKFGVIYKHPVSTSGRKDELSVSSMFRLFFSNFMAIFLFVLHFILPSKLNRFLGTRLLGYWYKRRS